MFEIGAGVESDGVADATAFLRFVDVGLWRMTLWSITIPLALVATYWVSALLIARKRASATSQAPDAIAPIRPIVPFAAFGALHCVAMAATGAGLWLWPRPSSAMESVTFTCLTIAFAVGAMACVYVCLYLHTLQARQLAALPVKQAFLTRDDAGRPLQSGNGLRGGEKSLAGWLGLAVVLSVVAGWLMLATAWGMHQFAEEVSDDPFPERIRELSLPIDAAEEPALDDR